MALVAWAVAALANPAAADITNKFTFNDGTANDPVGGAVGTLIDNTHIANFAGGVLNLSANNNANSNQNFANPATSGAYLDLPNGIFTSAVNGGTAGQASVEIWFNTQQNRNWAEVWTFGTSNNGEDDVSAGAGTSNYTSLIPQSDIPDFRAVTHIAGNPNDAPMIGQATPLSTGVKHHVVVTFDQTDSLGGANPNGTARLYLDNAPPVVAAILPDIAFMLDNNNWLGRSQYGDPLYDGFIDEFRIYNNAMTAGDVAASFMAGPEPTFAPTLVIDRATGAMSIANQTNMPVTIKGYSISSAAGSLNPATWTSIDAGTFDPNGTWSAQTSTSTLLAESNTGGTIDGGALAANTSQGIGTPWLKTPFEDVTFNYTLGNNTTRLGAVQFVGNGDVAYARSDSNGDGAVNKTDWVQFLPNAFKAFPADTTVAAYLKGDLDGDKDNDYADFILFKNDYLAANPGASVADLQGIPEPASLALAAFASAMLLNRRRSARVA